VATVATPCEHDAVSPLWIGAVVSVAAALVVAALIYLGGKGPVESDRVSLRHLLREGDLAGAQALLQAHRRLSADRDPRGNTPLHTAPSAAAVGLLVQAGADVNAQNSGGATALFTVETEDAFLALLDAGCDASLPTRNGTTALHHAAMSAWARAIERLLAGGRLTADVRDHGGNTALHRTAPRHADIARLLLDAGTDPNARNAKGETPLHLAAGWIPAGRARAQLHAELEAHPDTPVLERWYGAVPVLVERGAKLKLRADSGETALDRARRAGFADVIAYLESAG